MIEPGINEKVKWLRKKQIETKGMQHHRKKYFGKKHFRSIRFGSKR